MTKIITSPKRRSEIYRKNEALRKAREQNAGYGYRSRRTSTSISRSDIKRVEREIGRIVS